MTTPFFCPLPNNATIAYDFFCTPGNFDFSVAIMGCTALVLLVIACCIKDAIVDDEKQQRPANRI